MLCCTRYCQKRLNPHCILSVFHKNRNIYNQQKPSDENMNFIRTSCHPFFCPLFPPSCLSVCLLFVLITSRYLLSKLKKKSLMPFTYWYLPGLCACVCECARACVRECVCKADGEPGSIFSLKHDSVFCVLYDIK